MPLAASEPRARNPEQSRPGINAHPIEFSLMGGTSTRDVAPCTEPYGIVARPLTRCISEGVLMRLVVVSLVLTFTIACGAGYSSSSTSPSPSASDPAPGAAASSIDIPVGAASLGNKAFTPDDLSVAAGTTVTWINTDSIAHTSTSNASGWDSGIVAPAGRFSFTFPTAGTFQYHCAIHPGMVGTVIVR